MSKLPIVERLENMPLADRLNTVSLHNEAATTITELVSALREAEAILHNCHVTEGVCCCGDDMERHANPMDCGHTPVDHGSYVANQWLEDHASLLAKLEQSQ